MKARFFRIWPTYLAGLSIGLLCIFFITHSAKISWPYTGTQILCQLFFFRDILGYSSIDSVSWTLEIEIRFYLLAALLSTQITRGNTKCLIVFAVGGAIAVLLVVPFLVQIYHLSVLAIRLLLIAEVSWFILLFMFIGVLFNYHYREKIDHWQLIAYIAAAMGIFEFSLPFSPFQVGNEYQAMQINYALGLLVFSIAYLWRHKTFEFPGLSQLAEMSYSLYVVHLLLGYSLMYFLVRYIHHTYLLILTTLGIVFIVTIIIYRYVEKPTMVIFRLPNKMPLPKSSDNN